MSQAATARSRLVVTVATVTTLASVALGVTLVSLNADAIGAVAAGSRGLHAPDLTPLRGQPPAVIVHATFALAALLLGPVMLFSRKGATFHRRAGWTWVVLMAGAALSSFLLTGFSGGFSYIHVMSGLTLVLLPFAVHAARGHAVRRHSALMLWLFWVMLVGAAAFTLVPGRLVWRLFFG